MVPKPITKQSGKSILHPDCTYYNSFSFVGAHKKTVELRAIITIEGESSISGIYVYVFIHIEYTTVTKHGWCIFFMNNARKLGCFEISGKPNEAMDPERGIAAFLHIFEECTK